MDVNFNGKKKEAIKETKIRVYPMKSDFLLFCECGETTTYGSLFKTEWKDGMSLECRVCKNIYYPTIQIGIERKKI